MKRRFAKRPPVAFKRGVTSDGAPLQAPPAPATLDAQPQGSQGISIKEFAYIATQAWKARTKMLDPTSGEAREDMKRVIRHIDAILSTIRDIGFEIKDHTGEGFDYGQPLRLVATQPTAGLAKDTVLETLKPTIYWRGQIIQTGEVIVGIPTEQ